MLFRSDDRQVKSDLKRFKEFIEGQSSATGAWRGNIDAPPTAADTPAVPTSTSGLSAAPEADPAMDDPESGGPRGGL